jgi:hypothetical protein
MSTDPNHPTVVIGAGLGGLCCSATSSKREYGRFDFAVCPARDGAQQQRRSPDPGFQGLTESWAQQEPTSTDAGHW